MPGGSSRRGRALVARGRGRGWAPLGSLAALRLRPGRRGHDRRPGPACPVAPLLRDCLPSWGCEARDARCLLGPSSLASPLKPPPARRLRPVRAPLPGPPRSRIPVRARLTRLVCLRGRRHITPEPQEAIFEMSGAECGSDSRPALGPPSPGFATAVSSSRARVRRAQNSAASRRGRLLRRAARSTNAGAGSGPRRGCRVRSASHRRLAARPRSHNARRCSG